jgi:hypothetical protein
VLGGPRVSGILNLGFVACVQATVFTAGGQVITVADAVSGISDGAVIAVNQTPWTRCSLRVGWQYPEGNGAMRQFQAGSSHVGIGDVETLRCVKPSRLIWPALVGAACALSLLAGCGQRDGLIPPTYSPDECAKEALAEYDTNHDGYLDAKELERCPALKDRLDWIDQNGDHRLSALEIAGRIQGYADSHVALKTILCSVQLDGKPLKGATITFVPEKFMGPNLQPASGVSDERGAVSLSLQGKKFAGVQPGLYRVEVSKKDAKGQETVPSRYNKETILGAEVNPRKLHEEGDPTARFRLTSKDK